LTLQDIDIYSYHEGDRGIVAKQCLIDIMRSIINREVGNESK